MGVGGGRRRSQEERKCGVRVKRARSDRCFESDVCVCFSLKYSFIWLPSVSTYLMTGWNGCTTPVNTAALLSQSPMTTLNYTLYSCHTW